MTAEEILSLSYTDFVGYINQWNVLPGSFDTLNRWRVYSDMKSDSNVLEIACSTGFSSRELSLLTGAKCHGIDISVASIESAKKNKDVYAANSSLTYEVVDGEQFKSSEAFTHIVVGASLKFFNDPQKMINNINELLVDGGYLLASPFYTTKEVPQELIDKAKRVFGIQVTTESYKKIMWIYKDFEILYQEKKSLDQETGEELNHYCESTISKFKGANPGLEDSAYTAAFNRLLEVKQMSNDLRPYQGYVVLALRCRKELFGKRLVELF